jgi:hypothetical protein
MDYVFYVCILITLLFNHTRVMAKLDEIQSQINVNDKEQTNGNDD